MIIFNSQLIILIQNDLIYVQMKNLHFLYLSKYFRLSTLHDADKFFGS